MKLYSVSHRVHKYKTYVTVRKIIHTGLHIDYKSKYRNRVSTNPRNSNPCKSSTYCIE
jgi:hypothetical protein